MAAAPTGAAVTSAPVFAVPVLAVAAVAAGAIAAAITTVAVKATAAVFAGAIRLSAGVPACGTTLAAAAPASGDDLVRSSCRDGGATAPASATTAASPAATTHEERELSARRGGQCGFDAGAGAAIAVLTCSATTTDRHHIHGRHAHWHRPIDCARSVEGHHNLSSSSYAGPGEPSEPGHSQCHCRPRACQATGQSRGHRVRLHGWKRDRRVIAISQWFVMPPGSLLSTPVQAEEERDAARP
ncbi:MAG: hypothetical protein KDC39_10180 [Actinobacteria bacterium]|nr:hypothetical protein [Actinomycetota bacterium]